jgi:hypothetical protein
VPFAATVPASDAVVPPGGKLTRFRDDALELVDTTDEAILEELAVAARVTVGIWALVGEGMIMRIGVIVGNETGTGCGVGVGFANCEHAGMSASVATRTRNRIRRFDFMCQPKNDPLGARLGQSPRIALATSP